MKEDPSPCYYCKEHRPYCRRDCTHGWKEWKEAHEKRREAIGKKKRAEGLYMSEFPNTKNTMVVKKKEQNHEYFKIDA